MIDNNIAYTIFHSEDESEGLLFRKNLVNEIHKEFNKLSYIKSNVIMVNNLESYKKILKENKELRKISINGKFRFGAIGLIFTTFLCYNELLKTDFDTFLIFEDDAQINKNAYENVIKYLEEVPKNFDIISFYDNKAFYKKYNEKHDCGLKNLCYSYNDRSTLVYAISKEGVKKYLKYIENEVDNPVDVFLFDEKKNTLKYAIKPDSFQPFYSDNFQKNGDPNYTNSFINKTKEFVFKKKK